MNYLLIIISVLTCCAVLSPSSVAQDKTYKYVGTKVCAPCHKTDKQGKQLDIWQKSKHAEAYNVLTTDKANEIAKKNGFSKPAAESPECLQCHIVTADAKMFDKSFDVKEGVQCENCHGAGSAYKAITVMKDKAKAIAAGMREFKDDKAIEAFCKTCHNEKSPTFKEFKFDESWAKIKHSKPKS
jgi:excinuclease UvrABC ATPase subunit